MLRISETFESKQLLKNALLLYSSENGFSYRVEKSDKSVFTAKCLDQQCFWRIHASCTDNIWKIKTMNTEHICIPLQPKKRSYGYKELSSLFTKKIQDTPNYSAAEMRKD